MSDLTEIAHTLRRWSRRVEDMTSVWPHVGTIIARENARAFATRGASVGRPWKPLAASTIRSKASGAAEPLVRTGAMKADFTGRPMGIERYWAKQARFGAPGMKPVWQQKGTFQHGRRHIPPRLIQKLTPVERRKIADEVIKKILGGES